MKSTEWPKEEIRRLAQSSGKPLEVVCAEGFLGAGWNARLGSHFTDGDVIRELDVIVEKEELFLKRLLIRVRALVSCKGFPSDRSPLAYSVSHSRLPSFATRLLSSARTQPPWLGREQSDEPVYALEGEAAIHLLQAGQLSIARSLVAFDILERQKKRGDSHIGPSFICSRCRDSDRQLFGAIDSSIKAAFLWAQEDLQQRHSFLYFRYPCGTYNTTHISARRGRSRLWLSPRRPLPQRTLRLGLELIEKTSLPIGLPVRS